ncbi:MAG: hypothetical protein LBV20_05735 [Treponema sp.]|jgi:hypothetical protein|nr:hypothetical protein [Treponema sp.]
MKKLGIVVVVFIVSISLYAQVSSKVDSALSQFENQYPEYANKAYTTNNDRSWEDQMRIIMDRPASYRNISSRFTQNFNISLPTNQSMTREMLAWWEEEIMAQAGRSPGFPHVGGKAVDVSVRNLDSKGTQLLADFLQKNGLSILYERNEQYEHSYFAGTLLLHCY